MRASAKQPSRLGFDEARLEIALLFANQCGATRMAGWQENSAVPVIKHRIRQLSEFPYCAADGLP
jgi:hypothetical protein